MSDRIPLTTQLKHIAEKALEINPELELYVCMKLVSTCPKEFFQNLRNYEKQVQ